MVRDQKREDLRCRRFIRNIHYNKPDTKKNSPTIVAHRESVPKKTVPSADKVMEPVFGDCEGMVLECLKKDETI